MNNEIKFLPPFKRMCMSIGTLPSSFYASMSYYESMVWLYEYLKNEVIPVVNNNSEVTEELQTAFTQLEEYIRTYFDNLDIQHEVDVKLDEMALDGTLADMIAEYIKMQGQLVYDSVADMKVAENVQNGSFLKTYGYHEYNDGGGALYKARTVTTDDVIDEMTIISLHDNTLVAELIINNLNVKQLGAYGDGTHNDTIPLQKALDLTKDLYINNGTYLITSSLIFNGIKNITGAKNSKIITETDLSAMLIFNDIQNNPISQNCSIKNLMFDGNDHANIGMITSNYVNLYIENLQIMNCKQIGLKTKGENSRQQAELRINKSCIRNYNYAYADSIGILINSSDGTYTDLSVVDFEIAFKIESPGNALNNLHPWIHFTKLWEKSKAYVLPSDGGDLVQINGGFIDTIRTGFVCDIGQINATNISIYYANNMYNDHSEEEATTPISTCISSYPIKLFDGTNSTQLRISNIFAYAPSGTSNIITDIVNNDNSISNCIFNPSSAWTGKIIDYTRNKPASITEASTLTTSYKFCTKTGRLVTVCYRGTLAESVNAFTTIATLPYKPAYETFFQDGLGIKLYLTTNGYLQLVENTAANTQIRFTLTYLGGLGED